MNQATLLALKLCLLLSPLWGAAQSSSESDIINDPNFDEPDNIDYKNHTNAFNAVTVASFILRDGGAGGADTDNLPTRMRNITMNINSGSSLSGLYLYYPGVTMFGVPGTINGNSVDFSVFPMSAPDDGSITFTVEATFSDANVVDNQQLQLTITEASVTASGILSSDFASTDAGGASTDTNGDDNRIEVIADRLQYTVGPSDVNVGRAIVPAVTVEAVDVNGQLDLDAVPDIDMSVTGGMFSTDAITTVTADDGVAVFDRLVFDSPGTGLTLSAGSPGYTGTGSSSSFDVIDAPEIYLSELHYEDANSGSTNTDFVEVALASGFAGNLQDVECYLFDGSGQPYDSLTLDQFTVGGTLGGYTYYSWTTPLNTGPAGVGLSYTETAVLDLWSYEGAFSVSDVAFAGAPSQDLGVSEDSSTPAGASIQRIGSCLSTCPLGLSWSAQAADTKGQPNAAGAPLPVTLADFRAAVRGEQVKLSWVTATELNNDYMAVERSPDGRFYEEIGRLEGQGTTQQAQRYELWDPTPQPGINYYRLRQVDYDGQREYHGPVTVRLQAAEAYLQLWPSPTPGLLQIHCADCQSRGAEVQLFSAQGQLLQRWAWPVSATAFSIDVSQFPAGLYYLRWSDQRTQRTARFLRE